ncbi:MAG: peptidase domain-containing ABC transporter [Alphaproteobacteria bacterium]
MSDDSQATTKTTRNSTALGLSGLVGHKVVAQMIQPLLADMRVMAGFSFVINVLALAVPIFVLQVYDRVVAYGGLSTLTGLTLGVAIAILFDFLLRNARGALLRRGAVEIDAALARAFFARLTRLPLHLLSRRSTAGWVQVERDLAALRDMLAGPPAILLIDLPFVLLFVLVVWIIAPPVAPILTLMVPVFIAVSYAMTRLIDRASVAEREVTVERQRLMQELIRGRQTIKALNLAKPLTNRFEAQEAAAIDAASTRGALTDRATHLGLSLSMSTTVILTVFGSLAILDQQMTIGGLIATNMLAGRIVQPMNQLMGLWRTFARGRLAAGRVGALLEEQPDDRPQAITHADPEGVLALQYASLTYPGQNTPTLDNLTCTFKPGSVTGIIGPNGSGKTTLLNCLLGLYTPDQGTVLLDGHDMAQFTRDELAQWIGYVPQEPFLFDDTIADNIRAGRENIDDPAILTAAEAAGLSRFIGTDGEGFARKAGDGGSALTPGQRQAVSVARALAGTPRILIMDEPTANLDLPGEQALAKSLQKAAASGHTIIVVTHAAGLINACDQLLLLDQGKIRDHGPRTEVANRLRGNGGSA